MPQQHGPIWLVSSDKQQLAIAAARTVMQTARVMDSSSLVRLYAQPYSFVSHTGSHMR